MEQARANPSTQADFSDRYWRCFYEFKRRRFSYAQRRLCETILDLSIGQGASDVEIPSLELLAEAAFTTPNNLHPVIRQLCEANVLGREERLKTWWINDIDLWKRLGCKNPAADSEAARCASTAAARILRHNRLRSDQSELFPLPTTDAEVAAEGHRARASDWTATGLPPAVTAPPPLAEVGGPDPLKIRMESLKNRLQNSEIQNEPSEIQKVFAPPPTGTPPCARPGNPVERITEIPGRPGGPGGLTDSRGHWQLDHAGWRLFRDFETFCREGGDAAFTADYARQWQWRIWKHPLLVEMCLRETMSHVREGRRPVIRTRAGWIKNLWSEEEKRLAAPLDPEQAEIARRSREELEKHLGTTP